VIFNFACSLASFVLIFALFDKISFGFEAFTGNDSIFHHATSITSDFGFDFDFTRLSKWFPIAISSLTMFYTFFISFSSFRIGTILPFLTQSMFVKVLVRIQSILGLIILASCLKSVRQSVFGSIIDHSYALYILIGFATFRSYLQAYLNSLPKKLAQLKKPTSVAVLNDKLSFSLLCYVGFEYIIFYLILLMLYLLNVQRSFDLNVGIVISELSGLDKHIINKILGTLINKEAVQALCKFSLWWIISFHHLYHKTVSNITKSVS
jgi:hypothetical protein